MTAQEQIMVDAARKKAMDLMQNARNNAFVEPEIADNLRVMFEHLMPIALDDRNRVHYENAVLRIENDLAALTILAVKESRKASLVFQHKFIIIGFSETFHAKVWSVFRLLMALKQDLNFGIAVRPNFNESQRFKRASE